MKHPFDGLIVPADAEKGRLNRRDALASMVASAVGLGAAALAPAQVVTTDALNEEGAGAKIQIQATTLAVGEEGGVTRAAGEDGRAATTTEPFGEEAGKVVSQRIPGLEDGAARPNPATDAVNEAGARPPIATTNAIGEEGGGPVTAAVNEAGGFPVAVQPGSFELPKDKLEQAWKDLGAPEAGKALQGCALLYGHKQAVAFLKDNLKLDVKPADEKEIARLIAQLDDNAFATREKAEAELIKIGLAAFPAIQAAQGKAGSVEVKMRLGRILVKAKEQPAYQQTQRGLEVLVALRTDEARQLLETLAKATPETVLSQLAGQAQARLGK